jgi:hypothetical protein
MGTERLYAGYRVDGSTSSRATSDLDEIVFLCFAKSVSKNVRYNIKNLMVRQ